MNKKSLALVVGTRPNFMKIAPIIHELVNYPDFSYKLIHTGQHYDAAMSENFFEALRIPEPDINFQISGGSNLHQISRLLVAFEEYFQKESFDMVIVVGDVNATMAATIAAQNFSIPVAHVEAGLRSKDITMPEERNRIVIDSLSTLFFVSEPSGITNLKTEGKEKHVYYVGNVMIDCLMYQLPRIQESNILEQKYALTGPYCLATIHRPSNVDTKDRLQEIIHVFNKIAEKLTVIMPLHPRTHSRIKEFGLLDQLTMNKNIILDGPLGYDDFIHLLMKSTVVITDSGGIQEESTFLKVPCLTLRENTERPITHELGTNTLIGNNETVLLSYIDQILAGTYKKGDIPEKWDGNAAKRILDSIHRELISGK